MTLTRRTVTIVGDSSTGKTSLINVFLGNEFINTHRPTFRCVHHIKTIKMDGKKLELNLVDTPGQSRMFRAPDYPVTDIVMLCFSVAQPNSLESVLTKWCPEIRQYCGKKVPVVLVGTKIDDRETSGAQQENQEAAAPMTGDTVKNYCRILDAIFYMECSSKTGFNVEEVFKATIMETLNPKRRSESRKKCVVV